jgi:hypothetical protein
LKKNKPKILIIDIETAPLTVYCWGLFDQNISLDQVKEDWHLISFSAKWYGEKKMIYADQRNEKNVSNDLKMVRQIASLLEEADIVLGQNSKGFDTKKINSRIKFWNSKLKKDKIEIPSSYKHIDTLLLNKKLFKDTSNKLEYQSKTYNTKYQKLDHKEYPGFKMWKAALEGDKKVWKVIEKYNKFDVLSTEEFWDSIKAWDNTVNFNLYTDGDELTCSCGSTSFMSKGYYYTAVGKYSRHRCNSCGSEVRGVTNLLTQEKKKSLKRGAIR